MKYKLLDVDTLYRMLDRLTRPKHPEEKFLKVCDSVLTKYLIEPKYSAEQLANTDLETKRQIVAKIWNDSVKLLCEQNEISFEDDRHINKILSAEENNMFYIPDGQNYFDGLFDIENLLKIQCPLSPVPINIKRLLLLKTDVFPVELRYREGLKFPVEKIIVAEGITEEILLPVFAKLLDYDFYKNGVHLVSAGGKNQVARWYAQNRDIIKIPVMILLDSDAKLIAEALNKLLYPKDFVYLIQNGEFEDIVPQKIIKKTVNSKFKNEFSISVADLRTDTSMCKVLKQIFHIHQAGDFKKAEFARLLSEELKNLPCFSDEICKIISQLKKM